MTENAPQRARTRTTRPPPLVIGRNAPGHQPFTLGASNDVIVQPPHAVARLLVSLRHRVRGQLSFSAKPIAAASASCKRAAIAPVAAGLCSNICARTASSAIKAACVKSNSGAGTTSAVAANAYTASTPCAISATPRCPCSSMPDINAGWSGGREPRALPPPPTCGLWAPMGGWYRGGRAQVSFQQSRRCRGTTREIGDAVAVEHVAFAVVLRMHECIGGSNAILKCAGCRHAFLSKAWVTPQK